MSRFSQNDNMQFLGSLLIWIGISLAISLAISFILPFPLSLGVTIGVLLLLNFYLRRRAIARMRRAYNDSSDAFDSLSSIFSSGQSASNGALKYYCIICGAQHKQAACPKCGSKMKKVGS